MASCAHWTDLFQGDEIGDGGSSDVGELQALTISAVSVSLYATLLVNALNGFVPNVGGETAFAFPEVDEGLAVILGISNAAYLVNKMVPHTDTT